MNTTGHGVIRRESAGVRRDRDRRITPDRVIASGGINQCRQDIRVARCFWATSATTPRAILGHLGVCGRIMFRVGGSTGSEAFGYAKQSSAVNMKLVKRRHR
jgi:hypothetical protein